MAITLWNLFEATLLCLNAVCVLNEERFLAKFGWGTANPVQMDAFGDGGGVHGAKTQILNLVRSIRTVMKCKIVFNTY